MDRLIALAAKAHKPDLWGPVGLGMFVALIGCCLLAAGVSRERKTGKQSLPLFITGVIVAFAGIAIARVLKQ